MNGFFSVVVHDPSNIAEGLLLMASKIPSFFESMNGFFSVVVHDPSNIASDKKGGGGEGKGKEEGEGGWATFTGSR